MLAARAGRFLRGAGTAAAAARHARMLASRVGGGNPDQFEFTPIPPCPISDHLTSNPTATTKCIQLVHHPHSPHRHRRSPPPPHDAASLLRLRISGEPDLRAMLSGSGAICLAPAKHDPRTRTWRISGDATRRFSDLQDDSAYILVHSSYASRGPRPGHSNLRRELVNRALGEEGELMEAMLRIFPNMVSKQEWRIVQNEEVDAVISSSCSLAIGFHCNKLTVQEVQDAVKRVSTWIQKANASSHHHSFLLGKEVYVVMSGNLLPNVETKKVIKACKKHNFILLLKNGINFSMEHSVLPPQEILPINV